MFRYICFQSHGLANKYVCKVNFTLKFLQNVCLQLQFLHFCAKMRNYF